MMKISQHDCLYAFVTSKKKALAAKRFLLIQDIHSLMMYVGVSKLGYT